MKWIKIVVLSIVVGLIFYFAFYKTKKINLEGNWTAKEIIVNRKQIYPSLIDKFLISDTQILINGWTDSIYIPVDRNKMAASYIVTKDNRGNYQIRLSSKEKTLNGIFQLKLDTLILGPNFYQVDVKIKSKTSLIHFERKVNTTPPKPELPKKGQV